MSESNRLLAGRYEVGPLVGRGGMAEVHSGYDTRLGREVAIKILRSDLARDPAFLSRFRREAQSAAGLNHPAIVGVFDSGEEVHVESGGGEVRVPFIVMEFVHGRTLRDILHEEGPLDPLRATRIMAQVLRALDYSHTHGIIHRDIKPANVMIGDGDVAKVMDFGIARAIADTAATMTNTSVVIGTAQYLSPEQAQGHEIDARSDLYSAGCLFYELLTGRPPFVGGSPVAIAYQHVGEPPQPPSVHAEGVPGDLDVVLLHALAKDPDDRYQSGAEFADDLDAVLRREPTRAAALAVAAGELSAGRTDAPDQTGTTAVVPDANGSTAAEPPQEKSRKLPPWLPWLLGALAVLLVGLGIAWAQGAFDREPDPVTVPSVVGRTEAQAKQTLTDLQLVAGREAVKNSAKPGTVVGQDPPGGTQLQPGGVVKLRVSTGPGKVEVPNLRNFDQATAIQMLKDRNLAVAQIDQADSNEVGKGNVISTKPKAGTKVDERSAVTLVVSTGLVEVPDIVGESAEDAQRRLSKAGLGNRLQSVPGSKAPGTVVAQSYRAGEKVPAGTEVILSVVQEPIPTSTQTVIVTQSPSSTPTTPERDDEKPRDDGDRTKEPTPKATATDDKPEPTATDEPTGD